MILDPKAQLINRLDYVNATRDARGAAAREILEYPELMGPLLEIAMTEGGVIGHRACWIIEFVCKEALLLIEPHLPYWVSKLPGLSDESAIRPMAKLAEMLCEYHEKAAQPMATWTPELQEELIAVCFDWLIGPHKVASKAFSMRCLYLLGKEAGWVHRELRATLLQGYPTGSAGYKSRAGHLLRKLEESP